MTELINNGLTTDERNKINRIRAQISSLQDDIKTLGNHRSYSTAITKLDEARHWLADRKERLP